VENKDYYQITVSILLYQLSLSFPSFCCILCIFFYIVSRVTHVTKNAFN